MFNKEKTLLFNFYSKLFSKENINDDIKDNYVLSRKLLNLNEEFYLLKNNKDLTKDYFAVDCIVFRKKLFQLDLSPENYLFLKYMKFHLGFLDFCRLYKENNFKDYDIDNDIIKEFIVNSFVVCLEKNKRSLKERINSLSDFDLISNVCVRERLTLYNFLIEEKINKKEAKDYINKLYIKTFRNKDYNPVFKDVNNISIDDVIQLYNKT